MVICTNTSLARERAGLPGTLPINSLGHILQFPKLLEGDSVPWVEGIVESEIIIELMHDVGDPMIPIQELLGEIGNDVIEPFQEGDSVVFEFDQV